MATITLRPSGVGDLTECLPNIAPNWDCVNEVPHDGDTTFVAGDLELLPVASRDLYALAGDEVPDGATIQSVKVYNVVRSLVITKRAGFSRLLKTNGTVVSGGPTVGTTTYTLVSTTWNTNPVTGLAWTVDEINSLQAGGAIQPNNDGVSNGRCTQVYIEVEYTSAGKADIVGDGLTLF